MDLFGYGWVLTDDLITCLFVSFTRELDITILLTSKYYHVLKCLSSKEIDEKSSIVKQFVTPDLSFNK